MGLTGLKSDVAGLCSFPEIVRGGSVSLPCLASRGHLHSLAHGPLPLSSKPATLHLSDHSRVTSPYDHHRKGSPLFRIHVIRLGAPKQSKILLPSRDILLNHIFKVPFAT